jgi:hypothetical protein
MLTDQAWRNLLYKELKTKSLCDQISDLQMIKELVRYDSPNHYKVLSATYTIFEDRMKQYVNKENVVSFWDECMFYMFFGGIYALKVASSSHQTVFDVYSRIRDSDGVFRGSTIGDIDKEGGYGGPTIIEARSLNEIHDKINHPIFDGLARDLKELIVLFCETQKDWDSHSIA